MSAIDDRIALGRQVYDYFVARGLPPHQAAGIAGNWAWESGGRSDLVNPGDNWRHSPSAPHSIAAGQWNDRSPALVDFARRQGLDIPAGDLRDVAYARDVARRIPLSTQLDFAWGEMQGPERRALAATRAAEDLRSATAGAIGYHRPAGFTWANPYAGHGFEGRLALAQRILPAEAGSADMAPSIAAAPMPAAPPLVSSQAAPSSASLGLRPFALLPGTASAADHPAWGAGTADALNGGIGGVSALGGLGGFSGLGVQDSAGRPAALDTTQDASSPEGNPLGRRLGEQQMALSQLLAQLASAGRTGAANGGWFRDGGRVGRADHERIAAALRIAARRTDRNPSEGAKKSGKYAKGTFSWHGLKIAIENPKGSTRSGTDKGGKRWSVRMPATYGFVRGTEGHDGDAVDVYVGPDHAAGKVYVIDQMVAETGKFDEHKAMLSYPSREAALADYHKAFSDGKAKDRIGAVTEMTVGGFKAWLKRPGATAKPLGRLAIRRADGGLVPAAGPVGSAATGAPGAGSPALGPDQASAEPVGDLIAQAQDLARGMADPSAPRKALYLSRDNRAALARDPAAAHALLGELARLGIDIASQSMQDFDGAGGLLIVPDEGLREGAQRAIAQGMPVQRVIGALTGAGDGKPSPVTPDGAPQDLRVVQQVTPHGAVTRERVVTPQSHALAQAEFQTPGRAVRTVSPPAAIARRQAGLGRASPETLALAKRYADGGAATQPEDGYWSRLGRVVKSALSGDFLDPRRADSSWVPQPVADYVNRSVGSVGDSLSHAASHPEDVIGTGNLTGTVIGRIGAANLARAGRPVAQQALEAAEAIAQDNPHLHPWHTLRHINERIAELEPGLGSLARLPDGRWGVEIPNNRTRFVRPPTTPVSAVGVGAPLMATDVFTYNPTLRTAWPQLRSIPVHSWISENQSQFVPRALVKPEDAWWGNRLLIGTERADPLASGLHEVEHLGQGIESFPSGSSIPAFLPGGFLHHLLPPNMTPRMAYERTAGEWAAQQAAARRRMTPAQLRAEPLIGDPNEYPIIHYVPHQD